MMMEIAAPCRFSAEKYAIASFSAGYAEERCAFCPERCEQQPRQCAKEGERRRTAQQRKRGCAVHVVRHAVEFRLMGRVLLPENADVQLRHVRDGQSAADEEEHFNRLVAHPHAASCLHFANQFQQPFVQKTLAVVPAAQRRDARNAQRPQQERNVQQRLFAPEASGYHQDSVRAGSCTPRPPR